jgi:hypothetical protein
MLAGHEKNSSSMLKGGILPPFYYSNQLMGTQSISVLQTEVDNLEDDIKSELTSALATAGLFQAGNYASKLLKIGGAETFMLSAAAGLFIDTFIKELKSIDARVEIFSQYKQGILRAQKLPDPSSKVVAVMRGLDRYQSLNAFEFMSLIASQSSRSARSNIELIPMSQELKDRMTLSAPVRDVLLMMMVQNMVSRGLVTMEELQSVPAKRDALMLGLGSAAAADLNVILKTNKTLGQLNAAIKKNVALIKPEFMKSLNNREWPLSRTIRTQVVHTNGYMGVHPRTSYVPQPISFGEIFLGTLMTIRGPGDMSLNGLKEMVRSELVQRTNLYLQAHYLAQSVPTVEGENP